MFVMVSPLQADLNETLTSLKFATKVHNTHIGEHTCLGAAFPSCPRLTEGRHGKEASEDARLKDWGRRGDDLWGKCFC